MAYHNRYFSLPVRRSIAVAYGLFALVTIPWTIYLAYELPSRHLSHNWDVAWVGYDIALTVALALTALLALRRSRFLSMAATATSVLLVMDAWFDIVTARPGSQLTESVLLALLTELPLALITFYVAVKSS